MFPHSVSSRNGVFLLKLILKPLLFSQVLLLYRNEISNKGDTFNES